MIEIGHDDTVSGIEFVNGDLDDIWFDTRRKLDLKEKDRIVVHYSPEWQESQRLNKIFQIYRIEKLNTRITRYHARLKNIQIKKEIVLFF
jgi:hypothetical protein